MEENWDDCDAPAYVPNLDNRKVIRKVPPKSSKSQKRQFYENERLRLTKLKNEERLRESQQQVVTRK